MKIGDILTSFSILVSILALLIAWTKDRRIRERELADRIRSAAAHVMSKLERWQEISLSITDELQSVFVETSEMFEPSREESLIEARDFLWKEMSRLRAETLRRILGEGIEVAYIELYAYKPEIRSIFVEELRHLKEVDSEVFVDFIERTQVAVMAFEDASEGYTTAMMGDALRDDAWSFREMHKERTKPHLEKIIKSLSELISTPDAELLMSPKKT